MISLIDARGVGERWALASFENGDPLSLFVWRSRTLDPGARCGDVVPAVVRSIDRAGLLGFVELETGEPAFFNLSKSKTPPLEGAHIRALVRAEAYGDKLARISPTTSADSLMTEDEAFSQWRSQFQDVESTQGGNFRPLIAERIQAALDEASEPAVAIEGGGRVWIEQTRALTAIDVDSAGRKHHAAGVGLNASALRTIARQVCLRRLGGLMVVDLQGAPRGDKARKVADQFEADLQKRAPGAVTVLPPSPLGLLQATLTRRERPLSEYDPRSCSMQRKPLETFCKMLRDCQTMALADTSAFLTMHPSTRLAHFMNELRFDWQGEMKDRIGGRYSVSPDAADDLSFRISFQ